jgi:hypothetical protein
MRINAHICIFMVAAEQRLKLLKLPEHRRLWTRTGNRAGP